MQPQAATFGTAAWFWPQDVRTHNSAAMQAYSWPVQLASAERRGRQSGVIAITGVATTKLAGIGIW